MSPLDDARAGRIAARFARTVAIEWIQPREPDGSWIDYPDFEPGRTQTRLSVGRQPLAWTWTHRLVDWLRLQVWTLWG